MELEKMNKELKMSKKINASDEIIEMKKIIPDFTEKITNTTKTDKVEHFEEESPEAVEFKNLVKKYKETDDEIRNCQKKATLLKKQNKALHDKIIIQLEKMGETTIQLLDGKFSINSYKTTPALKLEYVEKTIKKRFKDDKDTKELLEEIEIQKEKNSKITKQLKRTFNRPPK